MEVEEKAAWHALPATEIKARLGTGPTGLGVAEVAARRERYGPNRLPERAQPGPVLLFLRQFKSPLIYVLIVAALVASALGDLRDAAFITVVVLVNALVGAYQEWKAESAAEALRHLLETEVRVRREGRDFTVPAVDLVPGDLVLLESGNRVPADLRLVDADELGIDESALTGESLPAGKSASPVPHETPVAERRSMAHAGTVVTSGRGVGVVVGTGAGTEFGAIAAVVSGAEGTKPPLIERMDRFARTVSIAVVGAACLLALVSIWRGTPLDEVFFVAIALAVSAIPEGLPVALTVVLSVAASRMARRSVIVRRMAAVEGLGSCTLIASDKTGTLTVNQQTLETVWLPLAGRVAAADLLADREGDDRSRRFARAALVASEAIEVEGDEGTRIIGDPVDAAFLRFGRRMGIDPVDVGARVLGRIPYESERRYAAAVAADPHHPGGHPMVALKGAVEVVLDRAVTISGPDGLAPIDRSLVDAAFLALSAEGYRVLAVAEGPLIDGTRPDILDEASLPPLTLLGLAGFIDPLRPDAVEAVEECRQAGVRVLMVTGDHPATALAISRQLGIARDEDEVVTGAMLAASMDPALVDRARVFARVTPLQKLDIVEALQARGHFVAVTGDGVNDAPALRQANIGVAMGSGTDVAKDASSMIVTDDRFTSIVAGIEEGRYAYDNVRKVTLLLVATGAAEVLLFTFALVAGMPTPLFAVQLLWLNLVTEGVQHIGLAFEPGEPGAMERPPRPPDQPIFDRLMVRQVVISALTMSAIGFGLFAWLLGNGWTEGGARNLLMLLFVLFENVQVFNARSERTSAFRIPISRNWLVVAATAGSILIHVAAMYIPPVAETLSIAPVPLTWWALLLLTSASLLAVMEVHKRVLAGHPA